MPLQILTVPCRTDNFAFILHDEVTRRTALIDAPEVAPIVEVLSGHGWQLSDLLITHHHDDHIAGVAELHRLYGCRVIGARADQHRLPPLDLAIDVTDVESVCGEEVHVIDVPGHTLGHVAYWLPGAQAAFTGDSLMAMGCGKLSEGTPAQMWDSLLRLRALPAETTIHSGHEYTANNMRFALGLEPGNPALVARSHAIADTLAEGRHTVPSPLAEEIRTNPFLRADDPVLQQAIGMTGADPVAVFAEVRARKDRF